MILTTRSLYFQHAKSSETGLISFYISFYKLISTIFKCQYSRLKPKVIHNSNYKNFNGTTLECLIDAPLLINFSIFSHPEHSYSNRSQQNKSHSCLSETFYGTVEKHAPLNIWKQNIKEADLEVFTGKTFLKKTSVCTKSKRTNMCSCGKSTSNNTFIEITGKEIVSKETLWSFVKPFFNK